MHFVLVIVVTLVISMDTLSNSQQTTDSGYDVVIERRKREPLGTPDVDLTSLDETPGISEGKENSSQHTADLRSYKGYEQNQPREDKFESKRGRKRPKSFYRKNKKKGSRKPKPPSKPRGDQSNSQEENNMKNMHHGSKNYHGSSEPPVSGSEEEDLPETTSFVEGRFTYGSSDSPFGMYNPRYNCFERFPRNYFLGVSSICQEERMRSRLLLNH